jgi:hypothetical protein
MFVCASFLGEQQPPGRKIGSAPVVWLVAMAWLKFGQLRRRMQIPRAPPVRSFNEGL